MSVVDKIKSYLTVEKKEDVSEGNNPKIFPPDHFKTHKDATDWIERLLPGTILSADLVCPETGKVVAPKGFTIGNKLGMIKGDEALSQDKAKRNIQKIHEDSEVLNEDRRADLNYKEKLVKGMLDRVTVELQDHESGVMTKMAQKYFAIDKCVKKLMEVKDKMNAGVKERTEALFNAEDIVLTRVVETVSFTLTLSKMLKTEESVSTRVDYEKIAKELMNLVSADLKPQVDAIIAEATIKTTIPASTKSPGLRIQPKANEGFVGDAIDMFKDIVTRFKSWAKVYDSKLTRLKRMI